MRYILAYVNVAAYTVHLDLEFVKMDTLMGYVIQNYRGNWTSIGVTVMPPNGHSRPSLRHTVDGQI